MTIEHSLIPDPLRHEPKGISSAASGAVYVANGSGSGTWTNRKSIAVEPVYGIMHLSENTTATSVATAETFVQVAGSFTTGVRFDPDFSANYLTVNHNAVYAVHLDLVFVQTGANSEVYQFATGRNGVATSTGLRTIAGINGVNVPVAVKQILTLNVGDVLYPMVTNTANAVGLTVKECTMYIQALRML